MSVKQIWHEFINFLKLAGTGNKGVIPAIIAVGWAKATIPFLGLYFSARILNQIVAGAYEACAQSVAVLLISQLVLGILERACYQTIDGLKQSCRNSIRQKLAAKAYELEYEEFEKQETLDSIRRADHSAMGSGGIEDQIMFSYHLFQDVFMIFYSAIFLVILFLQVDNSGGNFFTSYFATILLVAIYGFVAFLNGKTGAKIQNTYNEMWRKNDHANAVYSYIMRAYTNEENAKDLRIYQMQGILGEKSQEMWKSFIGIYLDTSKKVGTFSGKNAFLNQIAAGIAYIFVGVKAIYGVIDMGDILLYAGAINQAVQGVNQLISEVNEFMYRQTYLKSYNEFLERPSMTYDGTLPIEKRDDGQYEFEFHDVSFSYPGSNEKVLSHVNLKFTVGEKLAVVGQNGAGKTTLIKLLCRLYEPTDGYITLNGIDIWKYSYKEYVQVFSVVFQDFKIFSMPLHENIASGSDVEEKKVWEALDKVGLTERVQLMGDGIKSHLYNNNGKGIDLSGGEAQRVAIARALYKDAPFVILDEPTAALDPIAEAEIYENFNQLVKDKTAIYISHRMSSCKFCDHIVVLEQGKIAEYGTHASLLESAGIYARLYETQAQYYAEA